MKTTLTFDYEGKTYVSKQFDFETLCLINDHRSIESEGMARMTTDAVDYMFRETEGSAVIAKLSPGTRLRLCREAWDMYVGAVKNG